MLKREKLIKALFTGSGVLSVVILLGIFFLLLYNSIPAFRRIGFWGFFGSTVWNPTAYSRPAYGILSLIVSTLMVTAGAMLISIPLGIGCAVYLAEVASPSVREIVKPVIEILAGIPSVVIGFLGIVLVGPAIAKIFNLYNGLNALNGSILLAIMALPTIISISEDAISSVPREYRIASLALGASKWQTIWKVTFPAALSGVIASIMLGVGRAVGETMTVLMATGNAPAFPTSFLDSVRTMTATIAIELGEVPYNTTHYYALFVIGLVLFCITFLVNLVSDAVLHRYEEKLGK